MRRDSNLDAICACFFCLSSLLHSSFFIPLPTHRTTRPELLLRTFTQPHCSAFHFATLAHARSTPLHSTLHSNLSFAVPVRCPFLFDSDPPPWAISRPPLVTLTTVLHRSLLATCVLLALVVLETADRSIECPLTFVFFSSSPTRAAAPAGSASSSAAGPSDVNYTSTQANGTGTQTQARRPAATAVILNIYEPTKSQGQMPGFGICQSEQQ